jgi:hypothetical protein
VYCTPVAPPTGFCCIGDSPEQNGVLNMDKSLSRIVELASLAKGDSNGTKVRVLIRQSARASAEKQLEADLEHSGIHRDAIMMTSDFVP